MGKDKAASKKKETKKVVKKEESSDSSSSEEEVKKAVPVVKKVESSSDESSSEEEVKPAKKAKKEDKKKEEKKKDEKKDKKEAKKPVKKESSSEDSSSESEKEEKKNGAAKVTKDDSSSSEESDSEEEEKKPEKRKAEEVDDSSSKRIKSENGSVPVSNESGASSRVFVGNLSYSIDDDAIRTAFKDIGTIKVVEWLTDKTTGKFYGCGFLTFESPEIAAQALSLTQTDVMGRAMKVEPETAHQGNKKAPTPFNASKPLGKKPEGCTTVFLGNLSFQIQDENVHELFADCGEIKQIRWLNDKETQNFKGCGFVEFAESDSTSKAVAHNGEEVLGRVIRIDYSESKPQQPRDGGNQRGGGGQRGGKR